MSAPISTILTHQDKSPNINPCQFFLFPKSPKFKADNISQCTVHYVSSAIKSVPSMVKK